MCNADPSFIIILGAEIVLVCIIYVLAGSILLWLVSDDYVHKSHLQLNLEGESWVLKEGLWWRAKEWYYSEIVMRLNKCIDIKEIEGGSIGKKQVRSSSVYSMTWIS